MTERAGEVSLPCFAGLGLELAAPVGRMPFLSGSNVKLRQHLRAVLLVFPWISRHTKARVFLPRDLIPQRR
jgi:hypothetical protein